MSISKEAKELHKDSIVIDLHCHPSLKVSLFNYDFAEEHETTTFFNPWEMQVDIPKLQRGGVSAIFSKIYIPERRLMEDCKLLEFAAPLIKTFWEHLTEQVERTDPYGPRYQTVGVLEQFEDDVHNASKTGTKITVAKNFTELKTAIEEGKIAVLHSIEGAHSLGRNLPDQPFDYLDAINDFYKRGVCMITLAHFYDNDIVPPVVGLPLSMRRLLDCRQVKDTTKTLTSIGETVVEKMLDIGMLVDLTHSTPSARQRIFAMNKARGNDMRPLVFSHVGVRSIFDDIMNPNDEEIRQIQDCNGVIGVILDNFWLNGTDDELLDYNPGIPDIIKTMKVIRDVTGTYDNIAFGSDFDGFTDPADDLQDISKMPYLTEAMLKEGFGEDDVKKILGGNAMRVLENGWLKDKD